MHRSQGSNFPCVGLRDPRTCGYPYRFLERVTGLADASEGYSRHSRRHDGNGTSESRYTSGSDGSRPSRTGFTRREKQHVAVLIGLLWGIYPKNRVSDGDRRESSISF